MDRKLCVLVYSQYSPACKRFVDYVSSLPYDLARVTGMTMLQADSDDCRKRLTENGVTDVPCVLIEYFDGKRLTLVDEDVYKFVASVSRAVEGASVAAVSGPPSLPSQSLPPPTDGYQQEQFSKEEVMNAAADHQKQREDMLEVDRDLTKRGSRTPLVP